MFLTYLMDILNLITIKTSVNPGEKGSFRYNQFIGYVRHVLQGCVVLCP